MKKGDRKIYTYKHGLVVEWDGSDDVKELFIHETMTLAEVKKHYPEIYKKYAKQTHE